MEQPPNIIVIICDDLCWGDVARHGNPVVRTPALDRLHDQSVRCLRWCSGPLCSPARASLMTGRWHPRTRVVDTYCGRSTIDPGEPTLGRVFATAGYATGCFGKWHLGDCHPSRPEDLGFGETLWHRAGGIGQPGDFPENHARWHRDSYFDPRLVRNGAATPSQGYCSDIFTAAAIDFASRHRERPFLAYLAFNAPHSPLLVDDVWADPYRRLGINQTHARLYGMVANIDWNVGRLRAALDRLGIAGRTLLLFTSDHGPCSSARDAEAPPGSQDRWNAGLRGIKGSLHDGGIRVPAFWLLPGRIGGGAVADPCHPVDVLPTLCSIAGVAPPAGAPPDGVDLLPAMAAGAPLPERRLFMQWHRGDAPVLHRNRAVIAKRWKLVSCDDGPDELYDMWRDAGERCDLAAAFPEEVVRLRADYERWYDDVMATRGIGTCDPVRIAVGGAEASTLLTQNDWRMIGGEGWLRDDLRGAWHIAVVRSGRYRLRARWRDGAVAGTPWLSLDGRPLELLQDGDGWHAAEAELRAGPCVVEAWIEATAHTPGLHHGRFLPALYVAIAPGS